MTMQGLARCGASELPPVSTAICGMDPIPALLLPILNLGLLARGISGTEGDEG